MPYSQILWRYPINWGSRLSDNTSLCQADPELPSLATEWAHSTCVLQGVKCCGGLPQWLWGSASQWTWWGTRQNDAVSPPSILPVPLCFQTSPYPGKSHYVPISLRTLHLLSAWPWMFSPPPSPGLIPNPLSSGASVSCAKFTNSQAGLFIVKSMSVCNCKMIFLAMSCSFAQRKLQVCRSCAAFNQPCFPGLSSWLIHNQVCWMNDLASESGCFCGIPEDGTINSSHEVGGIPREEGTRQPVLLTKKLPGPLRHIQRWQVKMMFKKCSSGLWAAVPAQEAQGSNIWGWPLKHDFYYKSCRWREPLKASDTKARDQDCQNCIWGY